MKISFPEELPVSRRREEIRDALAENQVVIVCGDTGSGKTTQLPKIALEMGRGRDGKRIGCTQPRRIAATSVAKRVAEELQVPLGKEVGYQIRFEDRTDREKTAVKFMTDGVLLAETRNDRHLRQYDTLIIDEAHERSLNIDFILGYLHRILKRRKDLKVILSSATLDAGSFSGFFRGVSSGPAPVVEVEGRTYPVEDRYQEPLHEREHLSDQIARAVEDLAGVDRLGDTLVFLPGEREIRDAAELLEGRKYRDTMILPLFARQSGKEQQAVFNPVRGRRRIILATNVAETSLTIPGIRFVIDSGIARIGRHDPGSGIQRLQVEPVSKASARQRRGRCGRVGEGICVRLYSEEDFEWRDDYTDPEILRSNLAGVVLQMEHLGLGDPLDFPFVDPPQAKRVAQAYRVLEEIGAIEKQGKHIEMTGIGRTLARLPLDPRVGRILVGAEKENCLLEGIIIASALTVQDPRERPRERQELADSAHGQFRDKRSDFTGWLRLWHGIETARSNSNNQLRKFCQKNFLNYRRVQEWRNLSREIRDTLRELKWKLPPAGKKLSDPKDTYSEPLHRAILAAIPSQIGMHEGQKKGYKGARNTTFWLFPGSGVFGNAPAWVMAFEMVETAKLYARNAAMFDPGWFEKVAPHLCRYRYQNPQWSREQGAVYGEERVIAFGLPVVDKRKVHYGRIDRRVARDVFLLEALVNGNTRSPIPALRRNRETLRAAERLEHKLRRLNGLIHPEAIVAFYEERLPDSICTQKDFEKWIAGAAEGIIDLALEDCLLPQQEPIPVENYPDTILSPDGEHGMGLRYLHNPADPADGITLEVPLVELPHLPEWFGEWLVPGWLDEKVAALLRCLPKETRSLLPANREVAEAFVDAWWDYEPDLGLLDAFRDFLHGSYSVELSDGSFDFSRMPEHLRMRFEVFDDSGKVVGAEKDLAGLQATLADRVQERFAVVARGKYEQAKVTSWDFGDLPGEVSLDRRTKGYPRLYEPGKPFPAMKLFASAECAVVQHRLGVAKLFEVTHGETVKRLLDVLFSQAEAPSPAKVATPAKKKEKSGDGFGSLAAAFGPLEPAKPKTPPPPKRQAPSKPGSGDLVFLTPQEAWLLASLGPVPGRNREDLLRRALGELLGEPLSRSDWEARAGETGRSLFETASCICGTVSRLLAVAERVGLSLDSTEPGHEESLVDAREHFLQVLAPGWLLAGDLPKRIGYLQGLEARLTRMLGSAPAKDLDKLERYREEAAALSSEGITCDCGHCPEAIVKAEAFAADENLRLKIFAPEVRARMK